VCVNQNSGSIESLNECQLFSSVCRVTGTVNSQIVHWLIVILCAYLCVVHLCQQCEIGIYSMSDLK
jgi:hypothetical protein